MTFILCPFTVRAEQTGTPVKSYNTGFESWSDFKLGLKAPLAEAPENIPPKRDPRAVKGDMELAVTAKGLRISQIGQKNKEATAHLSLQDFHSTPLQIGRSARVIAAAAPREIEKLTFTPSHYGLEGAQVSIMRRDLERAVIDHQGSPQEIWHNAEIAVNKNYSNTPDIGTYNTQDIRLILEEDISLVRAQDNILSRTSLIAQARSHNAYFLNLITGTDIRLNVTDNFNELSNALGQRFLPVRSDINAFTDRFISLDRAFTAWLGQLTPETYISVVGGYTEEQYQSFGGEVLWRPFDSPFAFGIEAHLALKRDPASNLNLGLTGDSLITGHLKAYYEPFGTYWRFGARAGRYLAEDIGATLSAEYNFRNGARFSIEGTYTDQDDFGVFGTNDGFDVGARLSFPIDGLSKYIPYGSTARINTKVIGRDTGQYLDNPIGLYEMTHPVSKRHITHHWLDILD